MSGSNHLENDVKVLQEQVRVLKEKNAKLGAVLKSFAGKSAHIEAEQLRLQKLKDEVNSVTGDLGAMRDAENLRCEKLFEKAETEASVIVQCANAKIEEARIKFDQQISAKQKSIYAKTYGTLNGVNNRHSEYLRGLNFQMSVLMEAYESAMRKMSGEDMLDSPEVLYDKELSVVYARLAKMSRKTGKDSLLSVKELTSSDEPVTVEFTGVEELNSLGEVGLKNNVLITRAVLPEGLKQLPSNFFFGCINLREVVLPSTLERIREFAFYGCTSLRQVEIKSKVLTRVDDYAFSLCEKLSEIVLPTSVERLGVAVFRHCSALEKCAIPGDSKLTHIGSHAFQYCTSLREIHIPLGVSQLPLSVFYGCESLRSLVVPESVRTVGKYTLYGCTSLKRVVVCNDKLDINASFGYLNDCEFIRAKR